MTMACYPSTVRTLLVALCCALAPGCDSAAPQPSSDAVPGPAAEASPSPDETLQRWAFDTGPAGSVPAGFETLETASSNTPATWGLVSDASAPSGGQGFGVLQTQNLGQTYNVALAPEFEASDVEITVALKAAAGKQDQGGGVAFRANGARDYYIARWNPLEKNVRFYVVVAEQRSAFAAADIDLDPAQWHTMRVIAEGTRMELFMDGTSVLVTEDDTLPGPGRVGLWTKADASTWFDDLTVQKL